MEPNDACRGYIIRVCLGYDYNVMLNYLGGSITEQDSPRKCNQVYFI